MSKQQAAFDFIDAAVARGEVPTPKAICAAMGEDDHRINGRISSYRRGKLQEAGFFRVVGDGKGIFGSPRWVPPGTPVPAGMTRAD